MLKRDITYKDWDGNTVTETCYFHISMPQLVEMEAEYEEGFTTFINRIVKSVDQKELIKLFKELVLKAYGKRSEDGKRFIQNDELREEFSQTNAYNQLFMEMTMDEGKAAEFIIGVLPEELTSKSEEIQKVLAASQGTTVDAAAAIARAQEELAAGAPKPPQSA